MRECIEEGILQGYVDDELSPEMTERVVSHLASCATCAEAAIVASGEMSLFTSAFEAENSLEIPTVRLRERIDAAIAEMNRPAQLFERKESGRLRDWLASFAGLFKVSPQRALSFASLIAVVAFAAIFVIVRLNRSDSAGHSPQIVAGVNNPTAGANGSPSPTPPRVDSQDVAPDKDNKGTPKKQTTPKKQVKPVLVPEPDQLPKDELAAKPLPGEQNYLKAIDTLAYEIQASGETAMKPSLRAEYERNLAIVDQAIDSTRRVARRNPNDPDASEFLYSSYQSKLDLLSAVAEQVRPTIATR
jgi:Putative zinc-finger